MIDTLAMALTSLRTHVLRSALTLLSIVIGITAIVGMGALIRGVDEVILGAIRTMNPHVVYLMRHGGFVTSEEQWREIMRRPEIRLEDGRAIEESCPTVGKLDLFLAAYGELSRGGRRTKGMDVLGVGVNYLDVNAMLIQDGRFFAPAEVATGARVMLLAKYPLDALFEGEDPLGKEVRLYGQAYAVIGTFVPQSEVGGFEMGQDNFCVIPHTAHRRDVSRFAREGVMLAMVPREEGAIERMKEEVAGLMRVRHRLRAQQDDDFDLVTQASVLKLWRDLSRTLFLALLGVSSIAFLVGGIGVMAVMMVAVTERTREIGVRRAVGATRGRILAQFLAEAAVLTALGGALGSGIGAGVAWGVAKAVHLPVATPWDVFALALGVSTGVGLVFGVVPAFRAARLDVVEALRAE